LKIQVLEINDFVTQKKMEKWKNLDLFGMILEIRRSSM
jgi:hypothetical protein